MWGAWRRARQSECSSLLTAARPGMVNHFTNRWMLGWSYSLPHVRTSGGLKQNPQFCGDHQVRDINHLPLAQLLWELKKKKKKHELKIKSVFLSLEAENKKIKWPTISLRRLSSAALLLASSFICKQMRDRFNLFRLLSKASEKYWQRTFTHLDVLFPIDVHVDHWTKPNEASPHPNIAPPVECKSKYIGTTSI